MKKICLCLLMFVLFFSLCTCGIFSAEAQTTTSVTSANGLSSYITNTVNKTAGDYIINITKDFTITSMIKINNAGSTVRLVASGGNRKITTTYASGVSLSVLAGTLHIGDPDGVYTLTIDGNNTSRKNSLINVSKDAYLYLHDKAIIQNNSNLSTQTLGGGVTVSGTFYMDGCTIQNCGNSASLGGGIVLRTKDSKFYMSGGTIKNCNGSVGGAACIYDSSNTADSAYIEISGGELIENKALNDGGAIYNYYGHTTITGTAFTGNTAVRGGAIFNNEDSASESGAAVIVTGGEITGNSATEYGGAIFSAQTVDDASTLTVNAGTKIYNNTAATGAADIFAYVPANVTLADGTYAGTPH